MADVSVSLTDFRSSFNKKIKNTEELRNDKGNKSVIGGLGEPESSDSDESVLKPVIPLLTMIHQYPCFFSRASNSPQKKKRKQTNGCVVFSIHFHFFAW